MRDIYTLNISGIEVTFDMSDYSESNRIVDSAQQLINIHDDPDYQLLYNFKMAKHAYDKNLSEGDPIADKYKQQYQELLIKVNERFPD